MSAAVRIGASEVATILGVSPWKTPLRLWEEKVGIVEREHRDSEWLEWGTVLEPIIAERYAVKSGRVVRHFRQNSMIAGRVHPTIPEFGCSLDGEVEDPPNPELGVGVLECKNVATWVASEWSDGPPLHYQVQGQAAMAVTGYRWASYPHLIGGNRLEWVDVSRHDGFIAAMEEKVREFVRLIRERISPDFGDWLTARDGESLADLYADKAGTFPLDEAGCELVGRIKETERQIATYKEATKPLEEHRDLLRNQLKAVMGQKAPGSFNAATDDGKTIRAVLPDGSGFTWTTQYTKGYEVAARTSRVLRSFKAPRRRA